MTQSTIATFISWVCFVFLIIVGLESSLRFSDEIKPVEQIRSARLFVALGYNLRIRLTLCILLAVIVLFSKPLSDVWAVVVTVANILFLNFIWKKLRPKGNK